MKDNKIERCGSLGSLRNPFAYGLGRVLKIAGNVLKGLIRVVYVFNPHWRVAIPAEASAYFLPRIRRQIPLIVWQTNFTKQVAIPVKLNYFCNRFLAASSAYRCVSDGQMDDFVATNFPGRIQECFERLTIGAARADLWRLLVLYDQGGIYMDVDAHLVWPVELLLKDDPSEIFLFGKDGRFTNYFLASSPGNPWIKLLIDEVLERIENVQTNNVYHITGPGVMDDVLCGTDCNAMRMDEVCLHGNFTNKYFQYIDNVNGHWITAKKTRAAVRPR